MKKKTLIIQNKMILSNLIKLIRKRKITKIKFLNNDFLLKIFIFKNIILKVFNFFVIYIEIKCILSNKFLYFIKHFYCSRDFIIL